MGEFSQVTTNGGRVFTARQAPETDDGRVLADDGRVLADASVEEQTGIRPGGKPPPNPPG